MATHPLEVVKRSLSSFQYHARQQQRRLYEQDSSAAYPTEDFTFMQDLSTNNFTMTSLNCPFVLEVTLQSCKADAPEDQLLNNLRVLIHEKGKILAYNTPCVCIPFGKIDYTNELHLNLIAKVFYSIHPFDVARALIGLEHI